MVDARYAAAKCLQYYVLWIRNYHRGRRPAGVGVRGGIGWDEGEGEGDRPHVSHNTVEGGRSGRKRQKVTGFQ